nr:G-type lectin S-receptor-like serine/threonine-protein kinase At2g19130 isoform X4 [Setaria viridis]
MVRASSWRSLFSCSFVLVFPSLINLVYPCCKFTYATDTLLPGQVLTEKHGLVSKNGAFRIKLFEETMVNGDGSLKVFSFAQIKKITKNFSEKLGEGGFGCDFKGTMPVSTMVAVKRLKGFVQGDKQFRAEVQTIGMIQHTNLVRLLGFCADFGMAKLLGRDYSRVLTTMRGTIGYLAPEWISGVPITQKADVYSYGMMLLEIISGRRNSEKIKEGKFTYFPTYAAVKLNEGNGMCLLDNGLGGNADAEQLARACRVSCWCIQDAADHRPMMGQVVRMLEGVMDVEVPPVPRSLQKYVGMEDSNCSDWTASEVSC